MNNKIAQKLINKTRDDYNKIAHHFSSTRKYNWPGLKKLLETVPAGKKFRFADFGCGNGRIYELIADKGVDYYGIDISEDLIEIAKKKHPGGKFVVGNILNTPYKSNFFDLTISVATLHHIPSKASRRAALREIYRVTKPHGKVIITNWYFWNKPNHLKAIMTEAAKKLLGKSELDFGDFYMPWKSVHGNVLTERYFHAWRKKELRQELEKAGFKKISIIKEKNDNNVIAISLK